MKGKAGRNRRADTRSGARTDTSSCDDIGTLSARGCTGSGFGARQYHVSPPSPFAFSYTYGREEIRSRHLDTCTSLQHPFMPKMRDPSLSACAVRRTFIYIRDVFLSVHRGSVPSEREHLAPENGALRTHPISN
jgi:hypothetical protein